MSRAADALADARAQTTLDYAVGAGVFLLAVGFALAFVPDLLVPFGGADRTHVADRAATALADGALGDPASPSVLDRSCTAAFFERVRGDRSATAVPDDCGFDAGATRVSDAVGVGADATLNVTVERPDGSTYRLGDGDGDAGVALAAGPAPPDGGSVAVATRTVLLDGASRRLVVRAW